MELNGKVALVLGAIKGIGKAIGLSLSEQGARVALNYFDWEEALGELEQDFADTGQPHLIIKTNLLEVENITGLIQQVIDRRPLGQKLRVGKNFETDRRGAGLQDAGHRFRGPHG